MSKDKKVTQEVKKPIKKQKAKKPNIFKRIGTRLKDAFSEVKKVNWPNFSKVVKKTGVVLLVVVIFLVVISAFDYGLVKLLGLISPK